MEIDLDYSKPSNLCDIVACSEVGVEVFTFGTFHHRAIGMCAHHARAFAPLKEKIGDMLVDFIIKGGSHE